MFSDQDMKRENSRKQEFIAHPLYRNESKHRAFSEPKFYPDFWVNTMGIGKAGSSTGLLKLKTIPMHQPRVSKSNSIMSAKKFLKIQFYEHLAPWPRQILNLSNVYQILKNQAVKAAAISLYNFVDTIVPFWIPCHTMNILYIWRVGLLRRDPSWAIPENDMCLIVIR